MFLFYIFILHMYGILAWKRYDWAFLVLVASLPLYLVRFELLGIPFTLLEGMFLVLFGFWMVGKWKEIFNYKTTPQSPPLKGGEALKVYLRQRKRYPFTWGIILFAVSSFIGLAVAGFSNSALGIYKAYFIEGILFFILGFDYLKNDSNILSSRAKPRNPLNSDASIFKGFLSSLRSVRNDNKIILALAISALCVSLIAIFQKLTGNYWDGGAGELRITGPFPYPNALALFLGPIIVLIFFYLFAVITSFAQAKRSNLENGDAKLGLPRRSAPRNDIIVGLLLFTSLVIILYALILSKSDAGIAAVVISIFVGLLFINKKLTYSLIGVSAVVLTIVLTIPNLRQEFLWQIQLKNFSGEVRKQQRRETATMLKNDLNFIAGCGLSGYQSCVEPYHQEGIFFNKDKDSDFDRKIVIFDEKYKAERWRPVEIYMYPHNLFLNFWVELGLVGLLAVLILLFQYFYFGIKTLIQNSKFKIQNYTNNIPNKLIIVGLLAVMLEIFIHGAVDVPYFKNDLSFMWWLFFAMMGYFYTRVKIENDK